MQSDASGIHGYGYYSGYYSDSELAYRFVSKRWQQFFTQEELEELDSHTIELTALLDYLEATQLQDIMLVWITDSQSAVWSVNKGGCTEERALAVLSDILHLCDVAHIHIIALWVPREENQVADYLSHFAYLSDRDERHGWLTELGLSPECIGTASGSHQASR
jgi:ribonuclease HI